MRFEALVYVSVEARHVAGAEERIERCLATIPAYAPPQYQCRYQIDDSGVVVMEESDEDVEVKQKEEEPEERTEEQQSEDPSMEFYRIDPSTITEAISEEPMRVTIDSAAFRAAAEQVQALSEHPPLLYGEPEVEPEEEPDDEPVF